MKTAILIGGAVVGGVLLYAIAKKRPGESLATTAGREVIGAAGDVAAGAVVGVGGLFGIPATSTTQCERDLAAGRTWDASFSCPAGTFIGSVFNSTTIKTAEANDARQIDRIIEREMAARDARYSAGSGYDDTPGIY